jgi:hypothetical protein
LLKKKKVLYQLPIKGIPKIETARLNGYNGTIIPIMQFFGLKCPFQSKKKNINGFMSKKKYILMVRHLKKKKKTVNLNLNL